MLIDGESDIAAELVAERLLDADARSRSTLDGSPTPITITASVGIAVGVRDSAGRAAARRRHGALPGQGRGQELLRGLPARRWRPRCAAASSSRSTCARRSTDGEFRLVYQPIYNLDDLSLVGVEALLRWDHPTLGVIAARRVHPPARVQRPDPRGRPLGARRRLRADGGAGTRCGSTLGISVNVSARQLDDDAIVDDVRAALAISAARPGRAHDRDHRDRADAQRRRDRATPRGDQGARRQPRDRRLRHRLLLARLAASSFPIDTIKIDRAFTDALDRSPRIRRADPDARAARPGPRPAHRRRGRRDDRSARPPPRRARRRRAGLPAQQATRAGRLER